MNTNTLIEDIPDTNAVIDADIDSDIELEMLGLIQGMQKNMELMMDKINALEGRVKKL